MPLNDFLLFYKYLYYDHASDFGRNNTAQINYTFNLLEILFFAALHREELYVSVNFADLSLNSLKVNIWWNLMNWSCTVIFRYRTVIRAWFIGLILCQEIIYKKIFLFCSTIVFQSKQLKVSPRRNISAVGYWNHRHL